MRKQFVTEVVRLGGLDQTLFLSEQQASKPLLLFLHGGPGLPQSSWRSINRNLHRHFTVIHWDQRGAGRSYQPDIPLETMSIPQFMADLDQLIQYLLQNFSKPKLWLLGHSWGSILGLKAAFAWPEHLYAFVGIAQVVHVRESEAYAYAFLKEKVRKSKNPILFQALNTLEPPPYHSYRSMLRARSWVKQLGGFFKASGMDWRLLHTVVETGEISPFQWRQLWQGLHFSCQALWYQLYEVNLFSEISEVQVPVYFFEGVHDIVATPTIVQTYYEQLKAPLGKQLIWFHESAHWPHLEEAERFYQEMVSILQGFDN